MADEDSDPLHPISRHKPNDPVTTAPDTVDPNDPNGVLAAIAGIRNGDDPRPTDPGETGAGDMDDNGAAGGPDAANPRPVTPLPNP